jgi:hypothetical protein
LGQQVENQRCCQLLFCSGFALTKFGRFGKGSKIRFFLKPFIHIFVKPIKQQIMKQIVIDVPDNKYHFFMELIQNLSFIKVRNESSLHKEQTEFVAGTKKSLEQVEQHLNGEITLKTADQLYNEL